MNIVVLSGGTATNSLTPCFSEISVSKGFDLTYILPISDNGGSTSEILRIVGGPAIGDIRSRIVRIMNDPQLVKLLGYRLSEDEITAKKDWNNIVEGTHIIWSNVPTEVKEMCRAFFIHIQSELLKKNRSSNNFQFAKASLGNMFLTGARLFLGSLDAAIELMMRIGRCSEKVHVIPCINTNHTHHISAVLKNGTIITGQSQISHPSKIVPKKPILKTTKDQFIHLLELDDDLMNSSMASSNESRNEQGKKQINQEIVEEEEAEYANPIYILPELKHSQLHYDKVDDNEMLPAPIKKILYINPYGEEIKPKGNSRAISKIKNANMIVYSIGSLMTSLLPIIILGNLAEVILEAKQTRKVLLINNKYDRETFGLDGTHYVKMVVKSLLEAVSSYRQSKDLPIESLKNITWSHFITDIVYLKQSEIKIDEPKMLSHGIHCYSINSNLMENDSLAEILKNIITHHKNSM
ncbi:uncharacterized protein NDAI_0G00830 [Naumovozyma dairenensis CBS 421]|uniref:Uncharacterized protein n=1 Tax=Naumovozyma dairenensis (strain ATCC 10597 / BCRC 20456 / CBS 421 / NBRC 0211 / NRRL Y-12639) TaxID=1071378 RepID=G0WDJ8_NAUDC|nr:hypothetical protein NDAI_0G00830 [Naumovozyma dairenensis CBS 421]CCD25859.2 hypothetical protein NDAI_0G00830 [Naumovozyma dairenensis CBS 421]